MNQAEIEKALEKHIKAQVYWDESELDAGPYAHWYGGPTAAAEIAAAHAQELSAAREQIKALEAGFAKKQLTCGHPVAAIVCAEEGTHHCGWCEDLAAAREQLAEMREYMIHRRDCPVRTLVAPMSTPKEAIQRAARKRCTCRYFELLDAAPAGGRVLFSGEARTEHFGGAYDDSQGTSFHVPGWIGKDDTIVALRVTEAPPKQPEDEDWPRECPRCGAAGGSELGPCPMCKGAAFVDEDTEDA